MAWVWGVVASSLFIVALEGLRTLPAESLNTDISNQWAQRPKDCAEVKMLDYTENGVYTVYVGNHARPVQVYCDLRTSGGGWLVFQRREDGFENFWRNWEDYANGFGDLYGEFWLGNHVIHQLTAQKDYVLRVELANFANVSKTAEYSVFKVGTHFEKYRLLIDGYSGNAGDAMQRGSGMMFSTLDQDNDEWSSHCARSYKGGWWYDRCHSANLNGLYHGGNHTSYADGVNWLNYHYSYPLAQMKIRPVGFSSNADHAGD